MSKIGIGNSFLTLRYIQLHPGNEESVVNNLRDQAHTNLYKVLGQYDLLSIYDSNVLDNPRLYTNDDGIVSTTALSAYSYIIDDEYSSPNTAQWLAEASIVGLVYLELEKWLYTSDSGSPSGIHACQTIIKKLKEVSDDLDINIAVYGGFGKSELYVLVKTNKLEDIWSFTHKCRNITFLDCIDNCKEGEENYPIFANTITTPCFSYENIKNNNDGYIINNIEGKCRAAISVNCQSGFENYISDYFKDSDTYDIKGTFGANDIVLYTKNDIETSVFLRDLLSFRNKWYLNKKGPISTSTTIIDSTNEHSSTKVTCYRVIQEPLSLSSSSALEVNNPGLSNRLKTFFNNINSCRANRVYQIAISKLSIFTEYLCQLIDEYQEKHNAYDYAQRFYAESRLLEAIETAELGLTQRIESKINPNNSDLSLPMYFGDGVFSNLIALEYLIDYIFVTWSNTVPSYNARYESNGFPAYSDSFGFKVRFGETIFLPLVSTYNPLSKQGNWLTLTHEISHALYTRYGVGNDLDEFYKNVIEKNFKERVKERQLGIDSTFFDQVYELFAHWYDYYHFYDCDLKIYNKNIWESWILLPIVHENLVEYYFRSFVIYAMHNIEELRKTNGEGDKYRQLLNKYWDEHLKEIRSLPIEISDDKFDYINNNKKSIILLFHKYTPVMNKFYDDYRNDDFRAKINEEYEQIEVQLDEISKGSIVLDDIKNPYLLLKRTYNKNYNTDGLRASTALVLSLKNKKSFLYKHINNEENNDS